MGRHLRKLFGLAVMAGMLTGLGGCSETTGLEIPYPNLSTVERIKAKLLSKEEQEEAIEDLSLEQEQHRDKAIKEIEKK